MDVPRRIRFFCDQYILRKSYYTKYTINSTRKSDESHNDKENENKYLVCKVFEKLNQTLNIRIIKNQEISFYVCGYLEYGIQQIFTLTISLKRKLLKTFENE